MTVLENKRQSGLTLLEMMIAMAITAVVFAALLPQFRNIQNSWASKQGSAEAIQNGRVLSEYLGRDISKAVEISAVSSPVESMGFIEFIDSGAVTYRCDISADNYIQFGPVGNLTRLAGPVSSLKFSCYSLDDLDNTTADIASTRLVKVETSMVNSAAKGQDKNFAMHVFLRSNQGSGGDGAIPPGDFGDDQVLTEDLPSTKNWQAASQAILNQDGTVNAMVAYVKAPPPKMVRFAIYSDNSGEPGTLIVQSDASPAKVGQFEWIQKDIAQTDLTAGLYWLAVSFEIQNMEIKQSAAAGTGQVRFKDKNAVDYGFDATWGASSGSANKSLSLYAIGTGEIAP